MTITYRHADVQGRKVFYREAGDPKAPTILLLHGFPTVELHVPQPDPAPAGSLPRRRARLYGLWPGRMRRKPSGIRAS
jgi:hypothetical protein